MGETSEGAGPAAYADIDVAPRPETTPAHEILFSYISNTKQANPTHLAPLKREQDCMDWLLNTSNAIKRGNAKLKPPEGEGGREKSILDQSTSKSLTPKGGKKQSEVIGGLRRRAMGRRRVTHHPPPAWPAGGPAALGSCAPPLGD